MKRSVYMVVCLAMVLLVASGCGDPCDDKYDVGEFIEDVLFDEDIYDDDSDDLVCVLEDIEEFIDFWDGGDNEGPEPTYYYNFDVFFSITDDSGESILDVEPSSYNLLLSTENCGSFLHSKTPSVYSDYIRAGRYSSCTSWDPYSNYTICLKNYTPSDTLYFEFDDELPASCGDSAEVTLTIIVDQPGYAPVSSAYDFTLLKSRAFPNVLFNNSTYMEFNPEEGEFEFGEFDIYLQLVPE